MWSRVFRLDRLSQYICFGVVGSCIIGEIGGKSHYATIAPSESTPSIHRCREFGYSAYGRWERMYSRTFRGTNQSRSCEFV